MISFQSTADELAFVDVAKGLAKDRTRPMARDSENNLMVDNAITKEAANLGLLSLELPEDWEGLELPLISQVQILQALSYGDLGIVQGLPGAGDAASVIRLLQENEIFTSYKDEVIKGKQPTIAFVDATVPEEPGGDMLTIERTKNGYELQGTSQPVRLAEFADYVVVAGVDTYGEHVLLWLDQSVSWEVMRGDYRLGLLAAGIRRLSFQKAKVVSAHVLADGKNASDLITQIQARIRILQAAKEVGLMEAALDYATEYTAGRKAFDQEIAKFQGVSFRIAQMAMETRIANHLVWQAAWKADEKDVAADGYALRALHRSHRAVRYVTDSAVQLLGGHGFVQDFPVEKWMRDAQAQVSLYGRESDLLTKCGEQIISRHKEVAVT